MSDAADAVVASARPSVDEDEEGPPPPTNKPHKDNIIAADEPEEIPPGPSQTENATITDTKTETPPKQFEEIAQDAAMFGSRRAIKSEARKVVVQSDINGIYKPQIRELVHTCLRPRDEGEFLFEKGDWVELRGKDLVWRLARIHKVEEIVKRVWNEPEPEPSKVYFFYTPKGVKPIIVLDDDIRAPEEGLKAVFGNGPWLWLQYALLQMESWMLFEEDDLADFENLNIYELAGEWWDAWLNHPRNGEFDVFYNEQDATIRALLGNHILSEFQLMQRIRDDKKNWDFTDDYITIYTYLATLGDGLFTVLVTLTIQLTVPFLIVINSIDRGTESATENGSPQAVKDFPNEFCVNNLFQEEVPGFILLEKIVLMLVIFIYMLKVIPDTLYAFWNVSGLSNSTYANLNSLRNIVYQERKDTWRQWLGFKLDRWMNTAYLNVLYLAMLFILFLTENVLDIILNALAIDFIHEIDEQLANAAWWDRDFRWIKAGCIEMVIQINLDLPSLRNGNRLCDAYDIKRDSYFEEYGNMKGMRNFADARRDAADPQYVQSIGSALLKNTDTSIELVKTGRIRRFSVFDRIVSWVTSSRYGIFQKYFAYRTWSKWDTVLYMTTPRDLISEEELLEYTAKELTDFSPESTFYRKVGCEILTFVAAGRRVKTSIYNKQPIGALRYLFGGIVDWLTYALPLIFPLLVFASLLVYTVCK